MDSVYRVDGFCLFSFSVFSPVLPPTATTTQLMLKAAEDKGEEGKKKAPIDRGVTVNPLQKKEEDRTPYEKMEVATKLVKPKGEPQEDKEKAWHTPTEGGSARTGKHG